MMSKEAHVQLMRELFSRNKMDEMTAGEVQQEAQRWIK